MKNRIAALVVLACILLAFLPAPVRADVAPPPIPLVGGVGPFEYQDTNVQMVSERVEMELITFERIDPENPDLKSRRNGVSVDAWFQMHNTSSVDETMQVVFPLSNFNECPVPESFRDIRSYSYFNFESNSFKAQVEGIGVETKTITTAHPWSNECIYQDAGVQMDWAAFEVTFPAHEDTLIRVSYIIDQGEVGEGGEAIANVGYTLETGAAWKGPIGEAIIVFRFPYVVDQFILPGTTHGYHVMQNEIYWRYEDFEPDHSDNIDIAYISPKTWITIRENRSRIRKNPKDDAAWVVLADSYYNISHWHGTNVRSDEYAQRVHDTYRDGLRENPDSAVLNAGYAELLQWNCCFYGLEPFPESAWEEIRPYLQKALEQDPSNERALRVLAILKDHYPDIVDMTPGPTFTPTVTHVPTRTKTPTQTKKPYFKKSPTLTLTKRATITPKITDTPTLAPSDTAVPLTQMVTPAVQGEQATVTESNRTNWWERAALVASGFVIGIAWMWVWKRQSRAR